MKIKKINNVLLFVIFAFVLALSFRVISLGSNTLSNSEASIALSSFKVTDNPGVIDNSDPGIANINALLFSIFGATNFVARVLTALLGASFVFLPLFYKEHLEVKTIVILGFILALDAMLVAQSRILGSSIWAILFLFVAIGGFLNDQPILSGTCAGLAVLGGSSVWFAVIGLGLSLLWTLLEQKNLKFKSGRGNKQKRPREFWLRWLMALGLSLFIFGSIFFTRPTALAGISQGFINFAKSWIGKYDPISWQQLTRMLIAVPIYETIIFLFGMIGFILGSIRKNSLIKFAGRWFSVSILILIINPGRGIDLLAIAILPLCLSASWVISAIIQAPKENQKAILVKTIFVVVLCGFIWLNAAWIIKNGGNASPDFTIRLLAIIGGIVMIILVALLIGWGWSWHVAKTGLLWGLIFVLLIYNLGMLRRAAGFGAYPGTELISKTDSYPEANLFVKTMDDLVAKNELDPQDVSVTSIKVNSPSFVWATRKFTKTQYLLTQDPRLEPQLLITTEDISPVHADLYRGQTFVWEAHVPWNKMQIMDWFRWWAFQQAPFEKQTITLWAQDTLFPER